MSTSQVLGQRNSSAAAKHRHVKTQVPLVLSHTLSRALPLGLSHALSHTASRFVSHAASQLTHILPLGVITSI